MVVVDALMVVEATIVPDVTVLVVTEVEVLVIVPWAPVIVAVVLAVDTAVDVETTSTMILQVTVAGKSGGP